MPAAYTSRQGVPGLPACLRLPTAASVADPAGQVFADVDWSRASKRPGDEDCRPTGVALETSSDLAPCWRSPKTATDRLGSPCGHPAGADRRR